MNFGLIVGLGILIALLVIAARMSALIDEVKDLRKDIHLYHYSADTFHLRALSQLGARISKTLGSIDETIRRHTSDR